MECQTLDKRLELIQICEHPRFIHFHYKILESERVFLVSLKFLTNIQKNFKKKERKWLPQLKQSSCQEFDLHIGAEFASCKISSVE